MATVTQVNGGIGRAVLGSDGRPAHVLVYGPLTIRLDLSGGFTIEEPSTDDDLDALALAEAQEIATDGRMEGALDVLLDQFRRLREGMVLAGSAEDVDEGLDE